MALGFSLINPLVCVDPIPVSTKRGNKNKSVFRRGSDGYTSQQTLTLDTDISAVKFISFAVGV